jgi:hypothetical protein
MLCSFQTLLARCGIAVVVQAWNHSIYIVERSCIVVVVGSAAA